MSEIKDNSIARNVMWNTAGSLFYLICQWMLGVLVVRLSGNYADAGILSLAMSISTFFSVITLFNVRNYQVSDSRGLYSSSQYVFHRVLTCAFSLVLCIIFVAISGYDLVTSLSIIFYMLVKIVEGFADVLHGVAQRGWRLDIAGKSFIIRGILLAASFSVSMVLTQNLVISIFAMALATLIPLILYDWIAVGKVDKVEIRFDFKAALSLSKVCIPMVIYGACINAIVPFARFVLEYFYSKEVLGYYATVSTVAVLVQAFVTFVFTPLIGVFEKAYTEDDKKGILALLIKLILLLAGITLSAVGAVALVGKPVMVLIFGEEIRDYVYLLYPTIFASCLTALVWLLGMLLVVMRELKMLLIGAAVGFSVAVVIALAVIPKHPYPGANLSVIVAFAVISLLYSIRFIFYFFKDGKRRKENV